MELYVSWLCICFLKIEVDYNTRRIIKMTGLHRQSCYQVVSKDDLTLTYKRICVFRTGSKNRTKNCNLFLLVQPLHIDEEKKYFNIFQQRLLQIQTVIKLISKPFIKRQTKKWNSSQTFDWQKETFTNKSKHYFTCHQVCIWYRFPHTRLPNRNEAMFESTT